MVPLGKTPEFIKMTSSKYIPLSKMVQVKETEGMAVPVSGYDPLRLGRPHISKKERCRHGDQRVALTKTQIGIMQTLEYCSAIKEE